MKLPIQRITSLDVYRDGGSLSVSFVDASGTSHCLLFHVHTNEQFIRVGYLCSELTTYIPSVYESPITGIRTPMTEQSRTLLTWQESAELLRDLAPHVSNLTTECNWVVPEMLAAADNEGACVGT